MRRWGKRGRIVNGRGNMHEFGKILGNLRLRRKGGMPSHIYLIAAGVPNAWREGGMGYHIFHAKCFQKTLFL